MQAISRTATRLRNAAARSSEAPISTRFGPTRSASRPAGPTSGRAARAAPVRIAPTSGIGRLNSRWKNRMENE